MLSEKMDSTIFEEKPSTREPAAQEVGLVDLWHARLGPPLKITKLILIVDVRKSSEVLNKDCDVQSKQE